MELSSRVKYLCGLLKTPTILYYRYSKDLVFMLSFSSLAIVVAAYNEEEGIVPTLCELKAVV